ncbi:hypothetical protein PENSPDRAFT_689252 [Peniophora sp. CONT]|nr:hypothetical protein PENSPDRAFT_689252 [Peniophora sp. CONT]
MFPISCNAFGDILAVVQLVRDIAAALNDARGAASEYQRLIHELNMLGTVLEEAHQIAVSAQDNTLKDALLTEVRRCSVEDIAEAGKLLPGFEILAQPSVGDKGKFARARTTVKKLQWHFMKASDAASFASRFHARQLRINTVLVLLQHRQLEALTESSEEHHSLTREEIVQSTCRLEQTIDSSHSATISAVHHSSHEIRQDFSILRQDITSMAAKFFAAPSQRDSAQVERICDAFQNRLSSSPRSSAAELERQRFVTSMIPYGVISIVIVSQVTSSPGFRDIAFWATLVALLFQVFRQQSVVPTSVWSFSENVIIFIDVLGERMPVALQLCDTMEHFHQFLSNYYTTHERKGANYVRKKSYELYGPDDSQEALTFTSWSRYIAPGAKIEMGILLRRVSTHRTEVVLCPWCDSEARKNTSNNTYICAGRNCARPFAATKEASLFDRFDQPSASSDSETGDEYAPADVLNGEDEPSKSSLPRSSDSGTPPTKGRRGDSEPNVVQDFRRIHVIEMLVTVTEPEPPTPEPVPPVPAPEPQQASASTRLLTDTSEPSESPTRSPQTPLSQTPWTGGTRFPQTGPDIMVQPYRTGYETPPAPRRSSYDHRSNSPMPGATTSQRPSQDASQTSPAVQHPPWLQRAIDSGYRLDPSADRRNANPPLLSSDNNRSWTMDAQNADYTIDTQRITYNLPRTPAFVCMCLRLFPVLVIILTSCSSFPSRAHVPSSGSLLSFLVVHFVTPPCLLLKRQVPRPLFSAAGWPQRE